MNGTTRTVQLQEFLEAYPLCMDFAIRWGEMDAFAHLNNTVHFRYFETIRVVYNDRVGVFTKEGGLGPILAATACRYKIALTYPDRLTVGVRVSEVRASDLTQEYGIFSHTHDAVAAEGSARIVYLDYATGAKVPFSDAARERIAAFSKGVSEHVTEAPAND